MTRSCSPGSCSHMLKAVFVGLDPALCFEPSWLPRVSHGYASIYTKELDTAMTNAHRLAAKLLLAPELQFYDLVLHRCGNARCHNPYHLYIGGNAENSRDRVLHRDSLLRWGRLGLAYPCGRYNVQMPQPLAMSAECCRRSSRFSGFSAVDCFHSDWLVRTPDGFAQLPGKILPSCISGAHRRMYALFCGPVDKYDIVSHRCGDATCLNPYHLVLAGRVDEDAFDMQHDKRFKLSRRDREYIANAQGTAAQLAGRFGVHPQTVANYRPPKSRRGPSGGGHVHP